LDSQKFDAVVLGVAHNEFLDLDFTSLQNSNSLLYDVKGVLKCVIDGKL
jgi:UDP-N-acetyl-D-galactosamine dehydrogenase